MFKFWLKFLPILLLAIIIGIDLWLGNTFLSVKRGVDIKADSTLSEQELYMFKDVAKMIEGFNSPLSDETSPLKPTQATGSASSVTD